MRRRTGAAPPPEAVVGSKAPPGTGTAVAEVAYPMTVAGIGGWWWEAAASSCKP